MLRTLESLGPLAGKRVLLRCDLNVPLEAGVIGDDGRIRASLRTINELINAGARIVIVSHLGRPEGTPDPKFSLAPVAQRLSELLGQPVTFATDTIGDSAKTAVDSLHDGEVALLENLRFNGGEASKDETARLAFAKELSEFGDVFVSDGFGVVHRKQASVFELARQLPSAAGRLIESELKVLVQLTEKPARPYTVVLGGAKVSDKLGVIDHLLPRVDSLLIGGGMMFTFLAAEGFKVASSLLEQEQIETAKDYISKAKALGVELLLPTDAVMAEAFKADASHQTCQVDSLEQTPWGKGGIGLDIGPSTAELFAARVRASKTVFWNGPMGVFEFEAFSSGTRELAKALTEINGLSVVGGGDSAAAVRDFGYDEADFGHISTGGGASLEFLEGKSLPGLEVLGWQN
ncbi:MAG: phosphoglycerate kinase [Cryobacterium sp.]|nr:phosphoglycerate kinase [Cryobacterium sp.]